MYLFMSSKKISYYITKQFCLKYYFVESASFYYKEPKK